MLLGDENNLTRFSAEIVPGTVLFLLTYQNELIDFVAGGKSFTLPHSARDACGIPDGETIIMSGGYHNKTDHNYVTRLKFQYLKISKS